MPYRRVSLPRLLSEALKERALRRRRRRLSTRTTRNARESLENEGLMDRDFSLVFRSR